MFNRYIKDGHRNTLFMNYGKEAETIEVEIESMDIPEVWNTMTGEIKTAKVLEKEGNKYTIKLQLPVSYGVLPVTPQKLM